MVRLVHQLFTLGCRAALHCHLDVYDGKVLDHAGLCTRIQIQQSLERQLQACLSLDPLVDMAQNLKDLQHNAVPDPLQPVRVVASMISAHKSNGRG